MSAIDSLCINTIRTLSIDAVEKANSGHPGLPMGAAPMAYVLWQNHLRHNPKDPKWFNRDRFVLSGGHGSMLQYALLHLTGYDLPLEQLKQFRQLGSRTPGHPEFGHTIGVEATTGPLGQGSANAVGMAIAERSLAAMFNRSGHTIVDHYTYAIVTDGDLMEGINAEAASLAGHLKLGKLIYLYDANDISLDGPCSLAYTEEFAQRYAAYGWHVTTIADGNTDIAGLDQAISAAKAETTRPSLIIVKTTIGYGSPNKQGKSAAHGSPLGAAEIALVKEQFGMDPLKHFDVRSDVAAHMNAGTQRGPAAQAAWQKAYDAYGVAHPELKATFEQALRGELPAGWDQSLPVWKAGESIATRSASGKVINAIAKKVPWFIGGDADLSSSTKTTIEGAGSFNGQTGAGRNIHFGVREHAMAAIANGMAYHGGLYPFVATFFVFSDYMRPSVRLAAMNHLPLTCVWTHDSIAVGEDGPTHQPVEHLMALRCMPNMTVMRPADANETREAWRFALMHRDGPVGIVLTRQDLPCVARTEANDARGLHKGAYVVSESKSSPCQALLIATGSEVALALEAQVELAKRGVDARVVSMPSWEVFAKQPASYRDSVLPPAVTARVAVEAGCTFGWERWVGAQGRIIGIDSFGASGPAAALLEKFGFTVKAVVDAAMATLA